MFDTVKIQMPGPSFTEEFADWLKSEYQDVKQHIEVHGTAGDKPWMGLQWSDSVLGAMGIKCNKLGTYLWVERSIPKFLHGENCRVLSHDEAVDGVQALAGALAGRFAPWSPWTPQMMLEGAKIARLDVCYQQKVPNSQEVFANIARCLNATKTVRHQFQVGIGCCPVTVHLTGVTFKQSMREVARWYDKGDESGNESYQDVVRQEEQKRAGKARYIADFQDGKFVADRQRAIDALNTRYDGWERIEGYDLGTLMKHHGTQGAAAVGLVLHPEYQPLYENSLSRATFYRIKALAMQARRSMYAVDLSVPSDAWSESMVL